jgi:hypothetical protein
MAAVARIALACVLLAGLWGCGDDEGAAPPGGQTGSLVPRCVPQSLGSVPAGDGAFVGYTDDCSGDPLPDDVRLADTAGNVIALTRVQIGDDTVLLRADQALTPGRYTVSAGGGSLARELVVTEGEPLPMAIGSLTYRPGVRCAPTFALELDDAVLPFKALLRLSVTVDGGAPFEWVHFGELAEASALMYRTLPCPGVCLADGPHQLVLSAEVAGEALALAPLTVDFHTRCANEEVSVCSLPVGGAPAPAPWLLAFALAYVARARASRR